MLKSLLLPLAVACSSWSAVVATTACASDQEQAFRSFITTSAETPPHNQKLNERSASTPTAQVAPLGTGPKVDGAMDDECWSRATRFDLGFVLWHPGQTPAAATTAWVGRDDRFLYVGVRAVDRPGSKFLANQVGANNLQAGMDESVEVFILPADGQLLYFALSVSRSSFQLRGANIYTTWNTAWQRAVQIRDDRWEAEIAIPLHHLGQPKVADQPVRFNIVRNKRTQPAQVISWAPIGLGADYCRHRWQTDQFGELSGLGGVTTQRPAFAPVLRNARIAGQYKQADGTWIFPCEAHLTNDGTEPGRATLWVQQHTRDGRVLEHSWPVDIAAGGQSSLTFDVPVAYPAERQVRFAASREALESHRWCLSPIELRDLATLTVYPDRSLYWGNTTARLHVGCIFSDKQFAAAKMNLAVRVLDPEGRVKLDQTFDRAENQGLTLELPVSQWQPGVYPVEVSLRDSARGVVADQSTRVWVVAKPPPGVKVTSVDHERMCLLVNGKPFFPVGYMAHAVRSATARVPVLDDETGEICQVDGCEVMSPGGMNTWFEWINHGGGRSARKRTRSNTSWTAEDEQRLRDELDKMEKLYTAAGEHGLGVFSEWYSTIGRGGQAYMDYDRYLLLEKLPITIERLKTHPALLGWMGVDEMHRPIVHTAHEHSDLMRKLDPYHLRYVSVRGGWGLSYPAYELQARHSYWGPDFPVLSNPNRLASWVRGGYETGKCFRKPVYATPQTLRLQYRRMLNPAEKRCTWFVTAIQGAKGISLFSYPNGSAMHETVNRVDGYIAAQMQKLAPYLLQDRPPQRVTLHYAPDGAPPAVPPLPPKRTRFDPSWPSGRGPGADALPVIQVLIQDKPGGEIVLVANSRERALNVQFALSSLGSADRVREFFSGKAYPLTEGRFTETFGPYGVHVFETFNSTRKPGEPVSLGMSAVRLAELTGEDIMPNGSFEQPLPSPAEDASLANGQWKLTGPVRVTHDAAFAGQKSLLMAPSPDQEALAVCALQLETQTTYRVSLWVRTVSEDPPATLTMMLRLPSGTWAAESPYLTRRDLLKRTTSGWKQYEALLRVLDKPVTGGLLLQRRPGGGDPVLIDRIKVEKVKAAVTGGLKPEDKRDVVDARENPMIWGAVDELEQTCRDLVPAAPGQNLMLNSSFEHCTYPFLPDGWVSGYGYLKPHVLLGQQTNQVYHGRYSLRIAPCGGRASPTYHYLYNFKRETPYTFSVYAKAAAENSTLRLSMHSRQSYDLHEPKLFKTFTVGTQWQRVTWTFSVPGDFTWRWVWLPAICNVSEGGADRVIWIDAVQLELGDQATGFKIDDYEAPPVDPKFLTDDIFKGLQ